MRIRASAQEFDWCRRALVVACSIALAATVANGQPEGGSVAGVVRDSLGFAIAGAEVRVEGSAVRAMSDAMGQFRLEHVAPGARVVLARRLGFNPGRIEVLVADRQDAYVEFRLAPLPAQLDPVGVVAKGEVYDARLAGFIARRERGNGYFVGRDRLDLMHSHRFSDVLREVPGVRVGMVRGVGNTVRMRGAACSPLVFIDGFPAAAGAVDLDMVPLWTVEGIEIYSGLASVPAEFTSVRGGERCGVIAIWSRPHRSRSRRQPTAEPQDLERVDASRQIFSAEEVETPARMEDGSISPDYPDSLWKARVSGRVVVELVVDSSGRAQEGTLRVVSSTHPSFTHAVSSALEGARFKAAVHEGRPVRQLVQLPFIFSAREGESPDREQGTSARSVDPGSK